MASSYFCRIADLPHFRSQMLFIIGVLKSVTIFSGKYLSWSLFLIKFIKNRLQHRCFPVNIVKFLRTAFFIERLRWLLLDLFLAPGGVLFRSVKLLLEVSQNSQENTNRKMTLAQVFSCEVSKIFKNPFSCRIPPVASSVYVISHSLRILSILLAISNRVTPFQFSNRKHYRK